MMKIVLSGGGTGGHITPILAVAHELKRLQPDCEVIYIAEREGKFPELAAQNADIDTVYTVFAGKFRRYNGESLLRKLTDLRTIMLNVRDFFYFILGTIQSFILMFRLKPDAVFLKGGFVGVPVGLAAAFWRRPFVTHDSDAMPGLANRLVARWAHTHATGLPSELYPYPPERTKYTGVLVTRDYKPVNDSLQQSYRRELGLPHDGHVLFVTGGSLGATAINKAMVKIIPKMLLHDTSLHVIHQTGKGKEGVYGPYRHERLMVLPFLNGMYRYSGAADVIVTRAGANTIAEFGIQKKACIIIPNPLLAGGHQVKNGEYLVKHHASVVIDEIQLKENSEVLEAAITSILNNRVERDRLAEGLHGLAKPDAAAELASVLLSIAKERSGV